MRSVRGYEKSRVRFRVRIRYGTGDLVTNDVFEEHVGVGIDGGSHPGGRCGVTGTCRHRGRRLDAVRGRL